jgi:hypothetical protein
MQACDDPVDFSTGDRLSLVPEVSGALHKAVAKRLWRGVGRGGEEGGAQGAGVLRIPCLAARTTRYGER